MPSHVHACVAIDGPACILKHKGIVTCCLWKHLATTGIKMESSDQLRVDQRIKMNYKDEAHAY